VRSFLFLLENGCALFTGENDVLKPPEIRGLGGRNLNLRTMYLLS
jgi:hypothetical protein